MWKHVVTINAEIFVLCHENETLGAIVQNTQNVIDGRIVQWLTWLSNRTTAPQKLSGSDLIFDIAEYASRGGYRLFLLGAAPSSNVTAQRVLKERYPDLMIDGYSPPVTDDIRSVDWNGMIMERLAECRPDYLIVCFGPVKQEAWIAAHKFELQQHGITWVMGAGGTIDFTAGAIARAPIWVQTIGFEWLHRLLIDPRNRWRRTLTMFRLPVYAFKHRKPIQS